MKPRPSPSHTLVRNQFKPALFGRKLSNPCEARRISGTSPGRQERIWAQRSSWKRFSNHTAALMAEVGNRMRTAPQSVCHVIFGRCQHHFRGVRCGGAARQGATCALARSSTGSPGTSSQTSPNASESRNFRSWPHQWCTCILVYMNQGTSQKPSRQSKSVDALLECLLDLFFLAGMHENSCGKWVLWVLPSPARVSWHLRTWGATHFESLSQTWKAKLLHRFSVARCSFWPCWHLAQNRHCCAESFRPNELLDPPSWDLEPWFFKIFSLTLRPADSTSVKKRLQGLTVPSLTVLHWCTYDTKSCNSEERLFHSFTRSSRIQGLSDQHRQRSFPWDADMSASLAEVRTFVHSILCQGLFHKTILSNGFCIK